MVLTGPANVRSQLYRPFIAGPNGLAGLRRQGRTSTVLEPVKLLKKGENANIVWTQDVDDVTVGIVVDDGVRAKDIAFEIHPRRLRLSVQGDIVLDGTLDGAGVADPDKSFFTMEEKDGHKMCVLTVAKKEMGFDSWPALFLEDAIDTSITHQVYMDLSVGGEAPERVVFGLFGKEVPRTVENFRALCTGEKGKSASGADLQYKGSKLHRIIPAFMAQGGDFTNGDGTGGESIYGRTFEDERLRIKHDQPYLLSMANAGPDTNGSQFFITFVECPHLDGNHVVFGKVLQGVRTVNKIESEAGSQSGQPKAEVVIQDCGELLGDSMVPVE